VNPALDERQDRLRALLVAAQHGDGQAYAGFLRELTPYLRAYFRRRLQTLPDDVEDLVQETLLAVHNARHTYDAGHPVSAWVYAIARYKMVDLMRGRAGREALHDPLDEEGAELLTEAEPAAAEARRDLRVLLQQLPERQRLPIEYVKIEGLSVAEAAQRIGLSESAVKVGIHRGLRMLAALIGKAR
jgi:RNA polymerase sigma-70 factor, ECF subfamily